jgi:hypothetical protein
MLWVRKLLVSLFSTVTLLTLIGGVVAVSLNAAFAAPTKTEQWLDQSQLYDHLLTSEISQITQIGSDSTSQAGGINSNDPAVRQAIKSAFSKQLVEQYVHTFLAGNYAWLQGKTTTPVFKIDLSVAKQSLSTQIGQAVRAHLTQVPLCTAAQLEQIDNINLLTVACRPLGVDPRVEAAQVQQQIESGGALSDSIITADNLNTRKAGSVTGKPYYQRFSELPRAYQLAQKLPLILGVLALLSAVIIIFAAASKRLGWRHLAKILVTAGVLLSIAKLVFDVGFNKLQGKLFDTSSTGELQRSLTDFAHRAIDYVTHIELYGGLLYLLLAVIIISILFIERTSAKRQVVTDVALPIEAEQVSVSETPKPKPPRLGQKGSIQ